MTVSLMIRSIIAIRTLYPMERSCLTGHTYMLLAYMSLSFVNINLYVFIEKGKKGLKVDRKHFVTR